MEAVDGERVAENGHRRVTAVMTDAAARHRRSLADAFVLATGGILGGGVVAEPDGRLVEVVFGLPVVAPPSRDEWLGAELIAPDGHPVFHSGLRVDADLRPLGDDGAPALANLHAAGGILAGADPIAERSVDGIALATGRLAGRLAAQTARLAVERAVAP